MEIPQEILAKWKMLREHGDIVKIAKEAASNKVTVGKALNEGECAEELFVKISAFYNRRESLLNAART